MKPTTSFLALLLLFSACDRIDEPIVKGTGPGPAPGGEVQRKVLLEEYTGHKCTFCPEAHQIAAQLTNLYGDRLIIVSEHVGTLALPEAGNFDTDFRTPAGNAYFAQWPSESIPKGLINRTVYGAGIPIGRSDWANDMATEMIKTTDVDLWFSAFAYDEGAHQVTTTVKYVALNAVDHPLNLVVQLTEDHVVDYQLDGSTIIPNYDHRHVLRDNVNGTWGEILTQGASVIGDTLTRSFTCTLPSNVLEPSNCALVAYVYSATGDDQYQVKQVEQRKFVP